MDARRRLFPSARSAVEPFLAMDVLKEIGIGIAIGMVAGTTGTHGSARGRMTILAAVIGLVAVMAVVATAWPVRRALRIDPARALAVE